jgi:hypothetical protein
MENSNRGDTWNLSTAAKQLLKYANSIKVHSSGSFYIAAGMSYVHTATVVELIKSGLLDLPVVPKR